MKNLDTLGIMLDCSRNAVYTEASLRRLIDLLADMGYNMLMLYTEDTYEVSGEPYFGYFRGRYTAEQIRALDDYAASRGIELVPCIQTLAHLARLKQQDVYAPLFDMDDILLAGDERVYALIDKMFSSCASMFRTRRIHIGMDEAHNIGLGKYRDIHGVRNRHDILREHLARVCELAKKHGFHPMMWNDMYFRFATGGAYYTDEQVITERERAIVPEDMGVVYWDYYTMDPARYDAMIANSRRLSGDVWFAGGIWTWTGFLPHNESSVMLAKIALDRVLAGGIRQIFFTMWGDDGGECSVFSALPALYAAARLAHGETDEAKIKREFGEKYGIPYDEFCKIGLADALPYDRPADFNPLNFYNYVKNPSKYMLFNDPFLGRYDSVLRGDERAVLAADAASFGELTKNPDYGYLFDMAQKLCAALRDKIDLGVRARRAYKAGDREALAAVLADFGAARVSLAAFHASFRAAWLREKKPQGFEVQDIRLGGLAARLETCETRLRDYLGGKLGKIDELEETLLCCDGHGTDFVGRIGMFNNYSRTASQSCM